MDEIFADTLDVKGEIANFTFVARYSLLDEVNFQSPNMLQWGGVMLHTGFQFSSMNIQLQQSFDDKSVSTTVGAQSISAGLSGLEAGVEINSSVKVIPIEISTSLRLLYALTLYTGLGFDYVVSSKAEVELSGRGTINASSSGALNYSGTLAADEKVSGEGDTGSTRVFAGAQINLPHFRVYTHINKTFSNDILALNGGIKILW